MSNKYTRCRPVADYYIRQIQELNPTIPCSLYFDEDAQTWNLTLLKFDLALLKDYKLHCSMIESKSISSVTWDPYLPGPEMIDLTQVEPTKRSSPIACDANLPGPEITDLTHNELTDHPIPRI